MINYELRDELICMLKDYIRPYVPNDIYLDEYGHLNYRLEAPKDFSEKRAKFYNMLPLYEKIRGMIFDLLIRGMPFDSLPMYDMRRVFDGSKDSREYTIVLNIIFCLIKHGYIKKRQIVDAVSETTNTKALLELIRWNDYSVFEEHFAL